MAISRLWVKIILSNFHRMVWGYERDPSMSSSEKKNNFHLNFQLCDKQSKQEMVVLPTKQVVPGQGVEDAWGSNEVAHGSGESGGINPDGDKGVPHVDVSQEAVIPLKEDTVRENTNIYFNNHESLVLAFTTKQVQRKPFIFSMFVASSASFVLSRNA